jgi:hypothetical protein
MLLILKGSVMISAQMDNGDYLKSIVYMKFEESDTPLIYFAKFTVKLEVQANILR